MDVFEKIIENPIGFLSHNYDVVVLFYFSCLYKARSVTDANADLITVFAL